ncbi:MAG: biosynthetic arginine decarboxylase, partial [Thermoplasmatota archaeon]
MPRFTLQDAQELYRVDDWADGHLRIGKNGTLEATPLGPGGPGLDLHQVVEELRQDGMTTPVVLRFPQVLAARVDRINQAFADALAANECGPARYRGVFPIKVNQHQHVVKELAKAGRRWRYGLEVGSKAELVAALTMDPNRGSLLVVNGFKDKAYLKAACAAAHLKDEVIVVMDEIGELDHLIELLAGDGPRPLLGLRLKLRSKAPGKWALSGGDRSKFGLTIPEALHAVDRLRAAGLLDRLAMLHFHIGSQISDIRRIAGGVREAARIHAEMVKLGVDLRLLDVGGGLAVDYDGSGSSGYNSANYSMEEYANTVVATVKDVMDEHDVAMPDIISESGRSVVTHHAVLVVSVLRRVPGLEPEPGPQQDDDPTALVNLYQARAELGPKNLFETFHDVLGYREDLQHLFDLGH